MWRLRTGPIVAIRRNNHRATGKEWPSPSPDGCCIQKEERRWPSNRKAQEDYPAVRGGTPGTAAMDYTLAVLKVFGSQLADSTEAPTSEGTSAAQMLFGIRFQRVWIEGVILSAEYHEGGDGRLVLDDGSCVADLFITPKDAEGRLWRPGMYVMVIGAYVAAESKDNYPAIKVHKIVDLSSQPNREAMWNLEVIEAYNLFYRPSLLAASSSP